ncbi:hypothetical protein BZA77DRAFT_156462 [Pyronema omphalodes]|nr:hypothetical protein BZA77DRAFT_156462 [Pyronema omphalodes]
MLFCCCVFRSSLPFQGRDLKDLHNEVMKSVRYEDEDDSMRLQTHTEYLKVSKRMDAHRNCQCLHRKYLVLGDNDSSGCECQRARYDQEEDNQEYSEEPRYQYGYRRPVGRHRYHPEGSPEESSMDSGFEKITAQRYRGLSNEDGSDLVKKVHDIETSEHSEYEELDHFARRHHRRHHDKHDQRDGQKEIAAGIEEDPIKILDESRYNWADHRSPPHPRIPVDPFGQYEVNHHRGRISRESSHERYDRERISRESSHERYDRERISRESSHERYDCEGMSRESSHERYNRERISRGRWPLGRETEVIDIINVEDRRHW